MSIPIKTLMSSPQKVKLFALDRDLKHEFEEMSRLEYKKRAWQILALGSLIITLGGSLFLSLCFYCISLHYGQLLESAYYKERDLKLRQTLNDMKVDLARGSLIEIDGVIYRHDPKKCSSEDLAKEIIRQLSIVKKLDRFQLLLALQFAHQGMQSLSLRYLQSKVGKDYIPIGGNYTRRVTIETQGKNLNLSATDYISLMPVNRNGIINNNHPAKRLKIQTTLDLSSKNIEMLFSDNFEIAKLLDGLNK